jgi:hypothetical protein
LRGGNTIEEVVDEQTVAPVEEQVLVEVLVEQKTQHVFIHIESPNYAIVVDVSLTTHFVTVIAIITTSHEEGDNGHTNHYRSIAARTTTTNSID